MPLDQRLLTVNDTHSTNGPVTTLTTAHASLATGRKGPRNIICQLLHLALEETKVLADKTTVPRSHGWSRAEKGKNRNFLILSPWSS